VKSSAKTGRHRRFKRPAKLVLANAMRPYVETCIEAFGTRRSMFESNFPPDKEGFSYPVYWNVQAAGKALLRRRDQVSLFASLVVIQSARHGRSVGLGAWRWRRFSHVAALRGRGEKDDHLARCHVAVGTSSCTNSSCFGVTSTPNWVAPVPRPGAGDGFAHILYSAACPTVWTRPWTAKQEFTKQSDQENRIYTEPRCIEGNYGLPGLLHGHRMQELAFSERRGVDPRTITSITANEGEPDPLQ
jgi:hypothetical protein